MTMITRLGYCEQCSKAHRPQTNQLFIAFGTKHQCFAGMIAEHSALKGMTPHIYEFQRLTNGTVYFVKVCCMVGCGTYIVTEMERKVEKKYIYINEEKWEDGYMPLSDWNALVLFKDTGFRL